MAADDQGRHWDTISVSIMTLATAVMAGLFVFLRFPVLTPNTEAGYSPAALFVIVGVVTASLLYAGCIWLGMGVLASGDLSTKQFGSSGLRFFVIILVVLVVATVFAGIFTHLEARHEVVDTMGGSTPPAVQ